MLPPHAMKQIIWAVQINPRVTAGALPLRDPGYPNLALDLTFMSLCERLPFG